MNIDKIKKHFEEEAGYFDELILKLVPYYKDMMNALVSAIPFESSDKIKVIDLGCGTGTLTYTIKKVFPYAKILCVDLANNMLDAAKTKLQKYNDITFLLGDFCDSNFNETYDVIVSSLSLHHISTDKEKIEFYRKIYDTLANKGVFYNMDVILASNKFLQNVYLKKWKEFMLQNISLDEINNRWIPKYETEDNPYKLMDEIKWLKKVGFRDVDVIWKYYNFAVYGGVKKKDNS